jgi:reverse gyrase
MKIKYPIGGYAPGNYTSNCVSCKEEFTGNKYARQCEPCAINSINESNTEALARLHKLETSLNKIKFSNDTINEVLGNFNKN